MQTDPISEMLTIIRNGLMAGHSSVLTNKSTMKIDRGLVSGVSALNLATVNWFEIEAENGIVIRFRAEGSLGEFTPSHLRQHMITGQPVLVSFVIRKGEKIAIKVEDVSFP